MPVPIFPFLILVGSLKFQVLLFVFILTPSHFPNNDADSSLFPSRSQPTPLTHHFQQRTSPISPRTLERAEKWCPQVPVLFLKDACFPFPLSLRFKYPPFEGDPSILVYFIPLSPVSSRSLFLSCIFLHLSPGSISTSIDINKCLLPRVWKKKKNQNRK